MNDRTINIIRGSIIFFMGLSVVAFWIDDDQRYEQKVELAMKSKAHIMQLHREGKSISDSREEFKFHAPNTVWSQIMVPTFLCGGFFFLVRIFLFFSGRYKAISRLDLLGCGLITVAILMNSFLGGPTD